MARSRDLEAVAIGLIFGLTMMLLSGCGARAPRWLVFDKGPVAEAIAVDVESFGGPVTIVGNPNAPNITVRARLRARSTAVDPREPVLREPAISHSLDLINVEAELETDETGHAVLRVLAWTEYPHPEDQWVDLLITLPQVDGVRVQSRDGTVDLVNTRGAVTVANQNGNVVVRSNEPMVHPVEIIAANGGIEYRITQESVGVYDLEADNGRAEFRAQRGRAHIRQRGASQLVAQLGDGDNRVVLRSTNGNVRVVVTEEPVPVGFLTVRHRTRPLSK